MIIASSRRGLIYQQTRRLNRTFFDGYTIRQLKKTVSSRISTLRSG